ncbi:hypothetical protein EK0264_17640 [Epidermidibacterium keratini]|uniref:Uncharacterized protein n=1 Tax=Epidermidibacterium keratini TaxID=1891644 RepID=A0A7L4YRY1_9ACTN|nr:hypothetical protein [Epidermidibacterium keratini]QHC01916.1 hypothetical protein EK0264_17640 [Epidermidibacterium keratini]
MTAPRSGGPTGGNGPGGDNLWRDIAATVISELSDSLRKARTQIEQQRPPYDATPEDESLQADGQPQWRTQNPARPGSNLQGMGADLGRDFKDLVSSGMRATSEKLSTYQTQKNAQAERVNDRAARVPIRRAKVRAGARYAGAVVLGMGALTSGSAAAYYAVGGPIVVQNDDGDPVSDAVQEAPRAIAIAPGALALGMGAGAIGLTVSGRRYARRARELESALDASSISTARFTGPSPSAASAPLPPKSSAAYEPMRRLIGQRQALAELLPEVREVAPDLAPLAAESEQALFGVAERITLLERARDAGGGAGGEAGISAPMQRLVGQLEEGVQSHQKLVDAAATVLAELSTTHVPGQQPADLGEAADRLDALAAGLRQVRSDVPVEHPSFIDVDHTGHSATGATGATGAAAGPAPAPRPAKPRRRDRAQGDTA